MPTVLRLQGYRFHFYNHEPGEPPHVHIDKSDCSAKVWLDPVGLARNRGYRAVHSTLFLGWCGSIVR